MARELREVLAEQRQMILKDYIGGNVKTKHIYICRVGRYFGAYNPYTGEVVGYKTSDKFIPFIQEILDKFPDYSPHNVINEGIQELIRRKILMDIAKMELQKNRE